MNGLNARQAKFVAEYLKTGNAKQAAITAGYGEKSAESEGSRLLRNVKVAEKIARELSVIEEKSRVSVASLMKDLEEVKTRCLQREMVLDAEGTPTGEWQFDAKGALRAIELQGRHLRMFDEQQPKVERDVTPPGVEEKMSTTELIQLILDRRQVNALSSAKSEGTDRNLPMVRETDLDESIEGPGEKEILFSGLQTAEKISG